MNIPKELQVLRANVDELVKKYKETKAQPITTSDNSQPNNSQQIQDLEDMLFRMVGFLHQRISGLEDGFYNYTWDHSVGHIPKIVGASKMEACLKTLGLEGDYQVRKPMIAAASTQYGFDLKQ